MRVRWTLAVLLCCAVAFADVFDCCGLWLSFVRGCWLIGCGTWLAVAVCDVVEVLPVDE